MLQALPAQERGQEQVLRHGAQQGQRAPQEPRARQAQRSERVRQRALQERVPAQVLR